jgi:glycosyltransferase involved in cell wall biosynthesis
MGDKKKILIVHPDGNLFNNPNFYEIIRCLRQHYDVNVFLPKYDFNQINDEISSSLIQYALKWNRFLYRRRTRKINSFVVIIMSMLYLKKRYDLIIGVDNFGIMISRIIAGLYKVPHAMISYEIFFADENPPGWTLAAQKASKNVAFAIAQDSLRAKHLSLENLIPIEKIINIPVSSANYRPYKKSYELHEELNIPKMKKIIIQIGTIAKWTGVDKLIAIADRFPEDWVLVIHSRYGHSKEETEKILGKKIESEKIFFSNKSIENNDQMYRILHSAEIGIALYYPDFSHVCLGKNIGFIGLASGKFSTYLQNGVPVIVQSGTMMAEMCKKYGVGFEVSEECNISEILSKFESNEYGSRCLDLYQNELSFDKYRGAFNAVVARALG